jgi:hypothetical protein
MGFEHRVLVDWHTVLMPFDHLVPGVPQNRITGDKEELQSLLGLNASSTRIGD